MLRIFQYSLFLILQLLAFSLTAQVNKEGYSFIYNYSPKEYKSSNENWCSIINKNGLLYIGNTSGSVLEYDGVEWRKIKTKKEKIIYSLANDSSGIVYLGSESDFGRLIPDNEGKLKYQSLSANIIDSIINQQTFWKTYVGKKQEVYFCSPKYVYIFYKEKLTPIKLHENSWLSFYIDGKLYISNSDYGLLALGVNNKIERVENINPLKNEYIYVMYKISKNKAFISTGSKFYFFDYKNNTLEQVSDKNFVNNFLLKAFPYNLSETKNDLIWATIKNGMAITNKKMQFSQFFTESTGLLNNAISSVNYNNNDATIWATSLSGISKIELNRFKLFNILHGLKGVVYNAKRYNGELFAATDNGLYKLIINENGSKFIKIEAIGDNIVSCLQSIEINGLEKMWIGSESGLYEYEKGNIQLIYKDVFAECILQSKKDKNTIYIGSQNGLFVAKKIGKSWTFSKVKEINVFVPSLSEDEEGNCWVGTSTNGVYKLNYANQNVEHFTTKEGLKTINDIFVINYKNQLIFTSPKGLSYYDVNKKTIVPYYKLGHQITEKQRKVISAYNGYNNQLWLNINNRLYLFKPHYNEFYVDSLTFNRLPELTIYSLYTEPSGMTWVATSEGLYSYDPFEYSPFNKPICIIRQVKINTIDSTLYWGYGMKKSADNNSIKYKYNNLTFTFASPYFVEEKQNEYSYILEGFDEQWSNWSKENKAIYTNIQEGTYTFKVKSRNIYLQESVTAEFSFEIQPPWYRTLWAYFIYITTGIFLFIISIKLYTRKLEADKRKLEKIVEERTAEVVKQKNEIEEKNKEIEQKNKDITDSIYYAKRIQDSILPPVEVALETGVEVGIYFKPKDIVSGDFYFIKNIKNANVLIVAAADCTGHGVPGAFMSMLGSSLLNEIITKPEINHADLVLNELRESVINSLNQEGKETETKDGMDIAFVAYDYKNKMVEFAGANNPLYFIRNNELIEYKGDKMPVGLYDRKQDLFSRSEINVQTGDVLYIFSDGFADQFGGEKGKKYLYKRFKEFLLSIHQLPMNEQASLLEKEILEWRGDIEQIDDHIVIGIRIS